MSNYTYRRAVNELGPNDIRKVKALLEKSVGDLREVSQLLAEVWGKETTGDKDNARGMADSAYATAKRLSQMFDRITKT